MSLNIPGLAPILGAVAKPAKATHYHLKVGDSISETADAATFLSAPSGSGTAVVADAVDGFALLLTTQATGGAYEALKLNGEPFKCGSDRDVVFYAKLQSTDVSDFELYMGLHDDDTTDVIDAATVDGVGFIVAAAGNALEYVVGNGTAETQGTAAANSDLTDSTDFEVAFHVFRDERVEFFVRTGAEWSKVAKINSNIPTSNLTLVMQVQSSGNAEDITIKEVVVGTIDRA